MNILVIPDSHSMPGHGATRWAALGNMVLERRPDVIAHLGDLFDMESLCRHDAKTLAAEGRRLHADFESGWNDIDTFQRVIDGHFRRLKVKRDYFPRKILTLGNHEDRLMREVQENPIYKGFLGLSSFGMVERGWEVYPYKEYVDVGGIAFSHVITRGSPVGNPIGGIYAARNHLLRMHQSCISGHSHRWNFASETAGNGKRLTAIVAGVFLEPGHRLEYAGNSNDEWWNGVTYLYDVRDGEFDFERISTERLIRSYL